jgi:hypothetical protein
MRRNPIYSFKTRTQTGINKVPLFSTIIIDDADGQHQPRTVQIIDKKFADGTPFKDTTTIGEFLDTPSAYIDQMETTEIPSELEKITEGLNTGWRLLGEPANKFGTIGKHAVDFSHVTDPIYNGSLFGATGNYSLAMGLNTQARGHCSIAIGEGTISLTRGSLTLGQYNVGSNWNNIVEIGNGVAAASRSNAVEIRKNGLIITPSVSLNNIEIAPNKCLVTKEYSDKNLDSKYDKTGGTIKGKVEIIGNNDLTPAIPADLKVGNDLTVYGDVTFNKWIQVGVNTNSQSGIEFRDPLVGDALQPKLYWDNTSSNFFVEYGDSNIPQKLWNSNNDGAGSGLDADTIHGIPGNKLATKYYVNTKLDAGLALKYDKTGGKIDGNVQITGSLTAENDAEFSGNVSLQNIITSLTIHNWLDVSENTNLRKDLSVKGTVDIGVDQDTNSVIAFTCASQSGFKPKFFWNNNTNQFNVNTLAGNNLKVWHQGNFNPATKLDVTGGTITEDLTIEENLGVNQNLEVNQNLKVSLKTELNGKVFIKNLPNTDPGVQGQLWNDAGTLKVSL